MKKRKYFLTISANFTQSVLKATFIETNMQQSAAIINRHPGGIYPHKNKIIILKIKRDKS
jgi:hypothetical protein